MCFDHEALVNDETRVAPYAAAIRGVAAGRRVLDIGETWPEGPGHGRHGTVIGHGDMVTW